MNSTAFAASLERTAWPLDRVRTLLFAWALRKRSLAALLLERDRRLGVTLAARGIIALALAVYAPVLSFVLGPVALGVPHVASDLRYLVVRRKFAGWWSISIAGGCATLLVLAVLEQLRVIRIQAATDLAFVACWAALAIVAGFQRSRDRVRAVGAACVLLAAAALAQRYPVAFRLTLLHGHNVLALLVWPAFFGLRKRWVSLQLALTLLIAAWLATGAAFRTTVAHVRWNLFAVHPLQIADWLAPGLRADYALGLTSAFVFLQAAHYATWLSAIPQSQIRGEATLTFRMSLRSLLADFGWAPLLLLLGCWAVVVAFACVNPLRTSVTYVAIATFHAYLELVLLTYFFVARASSASSAKASERGTPAAT